MGNVIKYWKGNEKTFIFFFLVQLPFMIIHEISHLLFNWILGSKQSIKSACFMKLIDGEFKTQFTIQVYNKNSFLSIIGALAPSIVWFTSMLFLGYNLYYNFSIIYFTIFIYGFLGIKEANCSKIDLNNILKCMGID